MIDPVLHFASSFSAFAVTHLASAVWQGAILAAAVALCLHFLPRLSAASRSLVWLNVFLLIVVLHALPDFSSAGPAVTHAAPVNLDLRWSIAIASIWLALSLWRGGQLLFGAIHLHRLAARATPIPYSPELASLLATAPRGRRAELCISSEVQRPSVFGFFRPRILLPPDLAGKLTELELRQVVLHEMEHLRRADDWTNLLQKIALVLFPLNPALFWVERRLCAERELACDDRVLLSSGARKAYAVCLTRLAEYRLLRRGLSLVLGAWERRPELVRRVHRLLRGPQQVMGYTQARLVTAGLITAMLGGATALGRCPQLIGFSAPASTNLAADTVNAGTHNHRAELSYAALPASARSSEPAPHLVEARAILSTTPAPTSSLAARHTAHKPARRLVAVHHAKPIIIPDEQAWVLWTTWTDVTLPTRSVITVQFDTQGSYYAAVPVEDGWLIVKI
jgi:hypothetical protein